MNRYVEKKLKERMIKLGFKKKGEVFFKPINDNLYATVSFGSHSHMIVGHFHVDPHIGICNLRVNQLSLSLKGIEMTPLFPTTSTNLEMILKCDSRYVFVKDDDNVEMMDVLISDIQKGGEMFWTKMSDLDNLFEYCKMHFQLAPVLYYLRGEKEKGLQFMEGYVQRMSVPETDEEIIKSCIGGTKENVVIIRPGDYPNMTWKDYQEIRKQVPPGGHIVFPRKVGVDPSYLEFMKKYQELP